MIYDFFATRLNYLCFITGPFANFLAVKTSFRKVAIAGSLLLSFGYSVSFFIERLEILFLSIGLSAGKTQGDMPTVPGNVDPLTFNFIK